ncbi:zinc finger protein ZFPM2b [Pangasianodon hypophthalmus]|uniref:zinc finger protein ZFPM2b n=1 Tax=Pangasianodon hypophthalmus TaxID=310915 RepID=UPI0023070509|nr:zinc finger protein ZFPM2b [Pangasianodon hypophthalmus]
MSRRKQSNPRQFRRPAITGAFENGQTESEDRESEEKDILKDVETTVDQEAQVPLDSENFHIKNEDDSSAGDVGGSLETQKEVSEGHNGKNPSSPTASEEWDGPRELEMVSIGAEKGVRSRQALPPGTTWGPFAGKIERSTGGNDIVPLVLTGGPRWLMNVTWVSAEDSKNNCVVYSKGGHVWCSTTRSVIEGEELAVCVVDVSSRLSSIQLLPQQAAMASILPNAIINKDIFPCKTCGIWFRSERNLQAHLMYYCGGRPRESELASEKQTNTNPQISRTCTYPQCNMSFLGLQALKMHLSTHSAFKTEETSPGSSLKCTICDYTADTLMVLQPHILTHLSQTGLRCTQCHFTFQTPQDLSKHQELHRHGGLDDTSIKENQTEHSESIGVASPKDNKSIIESPVHQNTEQENSEQVQGATKAEVGSGIKAGVSYSRIKSEPSSPRLASSPIQNHMTPAFPMPPFLPHVPFSQDIPAVPQASEILAKMSELVHRRLRHGGTNFPPVMYGALVPKGATCFECNISFSNLDNYLVHKKHYCNGRWQHMSKSHDYSILDKASVSPKTGGGLASMLNAGHSFEVKGHNPTQFNTSLVEPFSAGGKAPEEFPVNGKKAPTPCDAEESPNGIMLDSKSPKMSESELDHNQTTCDACKITFSRHENYVVHKQYYCASRHDPPAKRAANNKHVQKSFRTRKRRKMPSPDPVVSQSYPISSSYMSQDTVESLKDQLHHRYNMIQGLVPKHPEPSLTVTKSALVSKCNAIAQEEGDAPIDLSKKCTVQLGKVSGLMDYHECAVCKISFNKVEDYLSHKQNFCPGAVLENKAPNRKEEGSRNANASDSFSIEHSVQSVNTSASAEKQPSIKDEHSMMNSDNYPGGAKKIRADEQIWPYYEIKPADYATGIFVPQNERRQSPNEGTEGEKEQPMPDGSHVGSENMENPKIKSLNSSLQGDDKQGHESCSTSTPNIHFTACTPDQEGAIKPKESISSSPASKMEEISSLKRSTNGSISAAVNGKYCRPCDIQFNNLSNFITHKKFYCSAHTTEHVK